jgi:iron complex transport system permease protein
LPFVAFVNDGWTLIISATVGALLVLLLVIAVSFKIRNAVSLLIVGIMFGMIAGSLVNVLQNFSNPDSIKLFVMWTFGSLSAVTWDYMQILFPVVLIGVGMAFFLQKNLDGLLLGENYARSLGISITRTRILIVIATGLLAGSITAFVGPIAFVGIAIPHIARGLFRTANHKILLPASILCGASLLLVCDIVSQIPTHNLPINTVTALFGAPIIIWIILKRK